MESEWEKRPPCNAGGARFAETADECTLFHHTPIFAEAILRKNQRPTVTSDPTGTGRVGWTLREVEEEEEIAAMPMPREGFGSHLSEAILETFRSVALRSDMRSEIFRPAPLSLSFQARQEQEGSACRQQHDQPSLGFNSS